MRSRVNILSSVDNEVWTEINLQQREQLALRAIHFIRLQNNKRRILTVLINAPMISYWKRNDTVNHQKSVDSRR